MLADLGLIVSRQIPPETIFKLVSGAYRLHGGVVRDLRGRIVSHLVTPGPASALTQLIPGANVLSGMMQHAQLWQLGRDVADVRSAVESVFNVSVAGVAMSGLGLVTSIAGFAYLSRRLGQVDAQLAALARDVKDIKDWLGSLERSRLHSAIESLRHAEVSNDRALSRDLWLQNKPVFGTLTHLYREQWAQCRPDPQQISAVNDLYTLSILGSATVCSNLGLHEEAAADLRSNIDAWTRQARMHSKSLLFAEAPLDLVGKDSVEVLPTRELIQLLDFAHDTHKGLDWIDELRRDPASASPASDDSGSTLRRLSELPGKIRLPDFGGRGKAKQERVEAVSAVKALRARSEVLGVNVAHYDFLGEKRVSATMFQKQLQLAQQESGADAICVQASPGRA
jgi:hypothetical protein